MTKIRQKLKRIKPGNIFSIELGKNEYCYGFLTNTKLIYSFFDYKGKKIENLEDIYSLKILFTVLMGNVDDSKTKWEIIGSIPKNKIPKQKFEFSKQDVLNPRNISIYYPGGKEKRCSYRRAKKLECAAVWYPSQIEDRLRDFFAGKPNKWLESLKIKNPRKIAPKIK